MNVYITTPIVCAVTGYFTNWLAIKMIFRPHKELKFLGMRVPFTPGVMVKERYRLSKQVGLTIKNHILTDSVINDKILTNLSIDNLLLYIENNISELNINDLRLEDALLKITDNEFLNLNIEKLQSYIQSFIDDNIEKKEIVEYISSIVLSIIDKVLNTPITTTHINSINLFIKQNISDLSNNDLFATLINEKLNDLFENFINNDAIIGNYINQDFIDKFIENTVPYLSYQFIDALHQNETLNETLKNLISKILEASVNKFILLTVNKDNMYDKLKEETISYIQDDDNMLLLIEKCKLYAYNLTNYTVQDALKKIPTNTLETSKEKIINSISNTNIDTILNLSEQFVNSFVKKNDIETIDSLLLMFNKSYKSTLYTSIESNIENIIQTNKSSISLKLSNDIKKYVLDFKVKKCLDLLENNKDTVAKLINFTSSKLINFISNNIDVSKMAEDEMNKLDIAQVENIVQSVIKKELNAITILGGVLGFVMGLIIVLIP